MAYSFKVKLNGDLPALLDKVKDGITAKGGSFTGDASRGKFVGNTPLGKVGVEYVALAGGEVQFTITDKPLIAPNGKIEAAIREYLA